MIIQHPMKSIIDFDWKDLHKKIGQVIYMEPSESDLAEGFQKIQTWFVTGDRMDERYLLSEQLLCPVCLEGVLKRVTFDPAIHTGDYRNCDKCGSSFGV